MKRKQSKKNWDRVAIGWLIIALLSLGVYTVSLKLALNEKEKIMSKMMDLYGQAILDMPLTEYEKKIGEDIK